LFLRSFIKSFEADDNKMIINYTLPLPPDNSSKEVVSVLGIVPLSPNKGIRTELSSIRLKSGIEELLQCGD